MGIIVAPLGTVRRVKSFYVFTLFEPGQCFQVQHLRAFQIPRTRSQTAAKIYQGLPLSHRPGMTSLTEVSNEIISRPARLILPFSGNLQLRHLASGFRLFFLSVAPIPSLSCSHLKLSTLLAFLQASNFRFFPLALGRIPQNRFLFINRLPSPPFSSFLLNPITRARPLSAVSASCHPHRRYLRIFPDHHSSVLFSVPIRFGFFRLWGPRPLSF